MCFWTWQKKGGTSAVLLDNSLVMSPANTCMQESKSRGTIRFRAAVARAVRACEDNGQCVAVDGLWFFLISAHAGSPSLLRGPAILDHSALDAFLQTIGVEKCEDRCRFVDMVLAEVPESKVGGGKF